MFRLFARTRRFSLAHALALVLIAGAITLTGCQAAPTATPVVQVVVVTATPADTAVPAATATPVVQIITATPMPATVTPIPPTATPEPGASIEVIGPSGSKIYSMDELKKLPATEGYAGIKSSTGKITAPAKFKGVSLEDLGKLAGTFDASTALNVVAKDGYAMTFSYDQIMTGAFTAFDPGTGDELKREEPLKIIVAYEREGQPINEETDGTLRLAIVTPKGDQVTDGHWAVKWVRKVELKPASDEWTLHMEGAIVEEMDRNTFESGAAPNCHLAQWVDADGKMWSGIPLYFLMGRVDDVTSHEGDAFDAPLAEKGYGVTIVAADGYKVTLDSAKLAYNKTVILANQLDGEPLPEEFFPLRLVGPSLTKGEMVGAVAQIVLDLPRIEGAEAAKPAETGKPAEAAKPTEAAKPAADASAEGAPDVTKLAAGTLHTYGKLSEPIAYTQEQLKAVGLVKISAEHPKKGMQDYEGVPIMTLIERSKPHDPATRVVFTSGDGYKAELPLADLRACKDCMVVLDGEGFSLVMPGQISGLWAKDVRLIEVK